MNVSAYYDLEGVRDEVRHGRHREAVGGSWDEIGRLQFEFLVGRGLTPKMRLLDLGCGSLRGGVHFARFLEPGRYYGIDISDDLLSAGHDIELARAGVRDRVPRANLRADAEFDAAAFGVSFDMALAQSLFTHLTLNHIRLCLGRLAPAMQPGGSLYATIFACDDSAWFAPVHHPSGVITYPAQDPYHYRYADIAACCDGLGWEVHPIGEWGHPKDQSMVQLVRV